MGGMDPNKIDLFGSGYGRGLSYDERKELEEKATTENVMNLAAQQGGVLKKTEHLELHGDDPTRRDVHDDSKVPGHDPLHVAEHLKDGALHTGYDMSEIIAEHQVENALGRAAAGVAVTNVALVVKEHVELVVHAWKAGDREAEARVQDAMHLALVGTLAGLPEGYVAAQGGRRSEALDGAQAETYKIAAQLKQQPKLVALLQLRCDEGMKCAEQAALAGEGTARYLDRHPALRDRYANDAAFRAGFDAMLYAKNSDPATYAKTHQDLLARDARNGVGSIVWQG